MHKAIIGFGAFLLMVAIIVVVLISMFFSYNNQENELRQLVKARQLDNKNVMDNMWKTMSEQGGIPDRERETATTLFVDYAGARTTEGEAKFMKWVKEAVPPSVTPELYKNLMNSIAALRADFENAQRRLIDVNRQRNTLIAQYPARFFISNTTEIDIVIVTSTRTDNAFATGRDDQTFSLPSKTATKTPSGVEK